MIFKRVTQILRDARKEIKQPNGAPWLPDGYGYINTVDQVNRLFAFLSIDKKQAVKNLFINKEVKDIDLDKLCIRFTIRSSDRNSFYTKSNEIMLMVYDESPDCYCKAIKPDGIENVTSENMGSGWYKVYLLQRLGWFGA